MIALDGRGGAGKSTLAAALGSAFDAVVIDGDDFYEGTFSARPELADLLDLRVRLDVSPEVQRARFVAREVEDDWRAWKHTWMDAEDQYFAQVVPDAAFDVVVQG